MFWLLSLAAAALVWMDTGEQGANNSGLERPAVPLPPVRAGLLFRLATVPERSPEAGYWIAYSPDGKTLGMTNGVGTFFHWRAASGTLISVIQTSNSGEMRACFFTLFSFTADGK